MTFVNRPEEVLPARHTLGGPGATLITAEETSRKRGGQLSFSRLSSPQAITQSPTCLSPALQNFVVGSLAIERSHRGKIAVEGADAAYDDRCKISKDIRKKVGNPGARSGLADYESGQANLAPLDAFAFRPPRHGVTPSNHPALLVDPHVDGLEISEGIHLEPRLDIGDGLGMTVKSAARATVSH